MKYLVTGGAGFIGSALANRLASDGHSVLVLDDLSRGSRERLTPEVQFTQGDVSEVTLLWKLLEDVDCVYHLAARVSVPQSILHPREYNAVNVGGTVSLMEAMRETGIRRVVLASSGAVYGDQPHPFVYETDTPNPDTPYAVSKWAAEQYVHTIGRLWDIETVALRIFNAYGPGQSLPASHPPVIPRFLHQALTGGSVVVFGDGNQVRDFVYLSDVVAALISAGRVGNVNRRVINIGSGVGMSINELVELVEQATGRDISPLYNRDKKGGVRRLVADTSLARQLLGFEPFVSLSAGLQAVLEEDPRFAPSE